MTDAGDFQAAELWTSSTDSTKETLRALAEGQLVGYRCVRGGNERRIIDRQFWLYEPEVDGEGRAPVALGHSKRLLLCLHFLAPDALV